MIHASDSGYVLHERATSYWASGAGYLSLKTFGGGRAMYDAGGGSFAVDPACFLVLNQDTEYTIAIEAAVAVESCCIFWTPAAAAGVYRAITASDDALLLNPASGGDFPAFVERTYRADDGLLAAIARLRTALDAGDVEPAWLEERLHDLLARLLHVQCSVQREIAKLPYARPATRDELYRRLHRARDHADASFERPLRLAELASVAAMSPNHLLRGFRQLFGCTPLQYLSERRIDHARLLLSDTDLPIAEVCLAIGFQSFGSFSRCFRRRTGCSPTEYRFAKHRSAK